METKNFVYGEKNDSLIISLIEIGKKREYTVLSYLAAKSFEHYGYQISLRKLSEKTCLSFKQTRTAISNLVKMGAINYSVVDGISFFTINK